MATSMGISSDDITNVNCSEQSLRLNSSVSTENDIDEMNVSHY